jgi:hypothetical protein
MKNRTSKIMTMVQVRAFRDRFQAKGKRLALTNGCFDILTWILELICNFAWNQADAVLFDENLQFRHKTTALFFANASATGHGKRGDSKIATPNHFATRSELCFGG